MAEIKIEKKKTIWPWVLLGLIIVALVAYFLFFKDNKSDKIPLTKSDTTETTTVVQNQNAVSEYISFIETDTANMSLDHEYSHNALVKLVNATEETARKNNVDINENLAKVKVLAGKITQNENATTHANDIKESAIILSNAISTIQQAKFPDLKTDAEGLMEDAKAVEASELTLDQKKTVKRFFGSAADVLKKMN